MKEQSASALKVSNELVSNKGLKKSFYDICLRAASVTKVIYSAYYACEYFLLDGNLSMGIISVFIEGNARCLVGWLQIDNVNTRALYTE